MFTFVPDIAALILFWHTKRPKFPATQRIRIKLAQKAWGCTYLCGGAWTYLLCGKLQYPTLFLYKLHCGGTVEQNKKHYENIN
jgi:hypothetical protein